MIHDSKPGNGPHLSRFLPWVILFLGLAATLGLRQGAVRDERRALQDEFNFRTSEIIGNIEHRLSSYERMLRGVAGLFAASRSIERDEFRDYVAAIDIALNYPGVQGVGFALAIAPGDKGAHVAQIRREGFPDYTIRPEGERERYTSIIYLEPFDWRNRRAFGYDMYSEPVRRAAMARSRDENTSAVSGKVTLVQETEKDVQSGFLMYLPVYRNGMPHATVAERRANLLGWTYSPFRMRDLMHGILGRHFGEVGETLDLEIYDGESPSSQTLMYDSDGTIRFASIDSPFKFRKMIDVGGHHWTVVIYSKPGFASKLQGDPALLITISGAGISLLLALIVWLLVNGRSQAIAMSMRMTRELRESESRLNALFENMGSGVAVYRAADEGSDFIFTAFNRAAEKIDQLGREALIGKRFTEIHPDFEGSGLLEVLRRVWQSGEAEHYPASCYRDERIVGWREYYVYKLPDGSIVAIYDDVTERHRAEQVQMRLNRALKLLSDCNGALVHAEEESKLLFEICRLVVETGGYRMAWVGFAEQDEARSVRTVASAGDSAGYLEQIRISWGAGEFGQGPTGTAIRTAATDINPDFQSNQRVEPWRELAIRQGFRSSIALPLIGKKGVLGALTIYSRYQDVFGAEEVALLEELANDLAFGIETLRTRSEHEAVQEQLEFLAHHDILTRLPNRLLLRDRFSQAISMASRHHSGIAMLFLDLDNFKQVNDSLGHNCGDQLLVQVAKRLQSCLRETDTISRQGGDEFVVLLGDLVDSRTIGQIAQTIVDTCSEPFSIDEHRISTSFSIGISLYPGDGKEFDTLLKNADTALYHAKDAGRNTYRFFAEQMNLDAAEQLQLQGQLHHALKEHEFLLEYQPQFEVKGGNITGVEALVRWRHPESGMIPPSRFIPLAERNGLIIPLGQWVLNEACRQACLWRESGLDSLVVAVNLSALQLKRGDLLETVSQALERSGLPASSLELELTESMLLQDMETVIRTLHRLKEMGVRLSIDDFGTGYSSLSYLKRLDVDKLKIDQSFVRDLSVDPEDAAIVKSIIQLGHNLNLSVIAEGVETESQLAMLKDYGCDEIQGYWFSKPLAAASVEPFIRDKG